MTQDGEKLEHRAFLNRYYGATRGVYDATRRYFLFGRDRALERLLAERWTTLVEVGVGTGRNLERLHTKRPHARYAGVDACAPMLELARSRCRWARFAEAFAEDVVYDSLLGVPPERILFSYALSMFGDPSASLERAYRALAPGGRLVVVDFGDFGGIPRIPREGLRAWLRTFHVVAPSLSGIGVPVSHLEHGIGNYFTIAIFDAPRRPLGGN